MNTKNNQFKNPTEKENDVFEAIERNEEKILRLKKNDQIDLVYGFDLHSAIKIRTGWLINMKTTDAIDDNKRLVSAMSYYFLEEDGSKFKSTLIFQPYFYIVTKLGCESEIQTYLMKKYSACLHNIEIIEKEDLDLDNHLIGLKKIFLKLIFHTIDDLVRVRKEIMPKIKQNQKNQESDNDYSKMLTEHFQGEKKYEYNARKSALDIMDNAIDIREYDVPYHVRVSIDTAIFIGKWYDVHGSMNIKGPNSTHITPRSDIVDHPEPIVLAYDIETTKLPLKFPDATFDQIMMISYMIDGMGYLICNREIIADDIEDFEFTPRPEFPGPFSVFNEPNEKRTIERFFDHIREVKPNIFVTYNGDFFDWPFVETRAVKHGLDMLDYIGFSKDNQNEYKSRSAIHMDCFKWVQRDSYLPIGAQGLKAVCKAKLRYNPVEVDPEEMCKVAREDPRTLANYSVSDAVATYYLYMKYVHPFIFALCTIIPMDPDEVLRKGSGTLCECLLMVEAFNSNIIFPNKQESKLNPLTNDGHVIESETYVGGHVEAIESGVFRSDIPTKFKIVPEMCKFLRKNLKETLVHVLEVEEKVTIDSVLNFDEVYNAIDEKLEDLEETNIRFECPVIYHLDVAAMYPNIILSNRLQPSALVNEKTCGACDFNVPNAKCKRPMTWKWRGEIMPATKSEYYLIQNQLEKEKFPPKKPGLPMRSFYELDKLEQATVEKERLGKFCRNAYNRKHNTRFEERTAVVCQRENAFYVDTVRAFRDRRYQYKDLTKVSKKRLDELISSENGDASEIKRANGMLVLYDSLQLAHKCILNSFYGYVMRKGARWYSMEMAGIVCSTGAAIIKYAREMIEQIGRPLELDTDGIWCILPASFPQGFEFQTNNPKKRNISFSYPGAMLNLMVQQYFTNDQYHDLVDPAKHTYRIRSENSIFFEVDGPYLAMILPASKEMNKKLKKRYAVFNRDRSLAELKGFEVKRNGELNLIKIFQSSVFESFLKGSSISEVYQHVAIVANYWLDLLYSRASTMPDEELFELISEKRCMSKKLEEYGKQKSTSISTARRLAEFLGDEMVKDAGLSFKFIISKKPEGQQVTDRAIPVAIFQAEESVKRFYLSKWLKSKDLQDFDIRNILDWDYYINRFSSNIQKIITIPAALQEVPNPVPRVAHPDWLHKILMEKDNRFKQQRITDIFQTITPSQAAADKMKDIENCAPISKKKPTGVTSLKRARNKDTVDVYGVQLDMDNLPNHWRDILGDPVPKGNSKSQFIVWLEFHKKKWKIQKIIKDQSELSKENINPATVKRIKTVKKGIQSGISSFFTRSKQSILEDTWQIIQITDTNVSGIYRVWVLIGQEIHNMKLTVPRTFYVNTRIPKAPGENMYFKQVHKLLPRSRIVYHLYEYNLDETIFIKHRSDILSEFIRNEVEGIYELEVPLLLRVYAKLGCMCSIDRNHFTDQQLSNNPSSFLLNELKFRSTAQHPYLSPNSIKTTFLFQQKSNRNEIIGWFDPCNNRAHLCLVEQSKPNPDKFQANVVQSWFSREREAFLSLKENESLISVVPEHVQFEVSSHKFEISAFKAINKLLVAHRNEVTTPTFIATKSKMTINELYSNLPALQEYPLVPITINETDVSFNVLDWQRIAIKSALQNFVKYEKLLAEMLERARYLHIPVGNMSKFTNDYRGISDSYDLFYGRFLMKNNFIWWCNDKSEPDLGKKENQDRRMMLVDNDVLNGMIYRNKPGCYPTTCVQLEMTYFPINTIIAMHKVMEIDGTNERLFESMIVPAKTIDQAMIQSKCNAAKRNLNLTSNTMYDDVTAAGPAFKILRNVILQWLDDVRNYKNPVADEHLMGFYKWMKNSRSLFYDPALFKSLQKLMRMVFFKLIEQLNNLGVEVIYGTLNKIVLCTKRTDLMDALVHVEYATKTVRNQDIFSQLDFQYVSGWDYLIWQDVSNYSGIKSDLESVTKEEHNSMVLEELSFVNMTNPSLSMGLSQSQNEDSFLTTEIADSSQIEMNWHLSRYLSPMSGVQLRLIEILQYFMLTNWKIVKDEYKLNRLAAKNDVAEEAVNTGTILGSDASLYPSSVQRMEDFLQNEMGYKLYLLVSQLKDVPRMHNAVPLTTDDDDDKEGDDESNKTPPLLPLKNKVSLHPIVDLIKTTCHILALDTSARYYVNDWKRNMFKLINFDAYSDQAKWRSPYSSDQSMGDAFRSDLIITVPEVICDNCNVTRDLDLCRDLYQVRIKNSWWFVCPTCDFPYDRNVIQETLIDQVRCICESNVMQDLKCTKCTNGILETSLAGTENCVKCGNAIQVTQNAASLKEKIKIYADIGKHYDLPYLHMMTSWMLQGEDLS